MKFAYVSEERQIQPDWIARAEEAVFRGWKESYCGCTAMHPDDNLVQGGQLQPCEDVPLTRWTASGVPFSAKKTPTEWSYNRSCPRRLQFLMLFAAGPPKPVIPAGCHG